RQDGAHATSGGLRDCRNPRRPPTRLDQHIATLCRVFGGQPMKAREPRMMHNRIVTREEWLARKARPAKEKELSRLRDQLSAERRELPWVNIELPWVNIEKNYGVRRSSTETGS